MALKAVIDSLDTVDEGAKPFYVQKEGKFVLDVEPTEGFELANISTLQSVISNERSIRGSMEKELTKFGSKWDEKEKKWVHTIDPGKAKQALAKYDEFMTFDPNKEADKIVEAKVSAAKEGLIAQYAGEIETRDNRIKSLSSTVEDLLITQQAKADIFAAKGVPELLLPHIAKMTRVNEKDGQFFVEVIDKDGNVRIGDTKGNPMTIAQLVEEMRGHDVYGRAFEGEGTSGTGKPPLGGGGSGTLKRSQMTPQQKREYQQKHGQAAYLKLPA